MMKLLGLALFLGVSFLCGPAGVWAEANRPMIEVTPGKMRAFKAAVQQFAEPRVPVPEGQPVPEEHAPRFRKELERGLIFSRTVVPLSREAFLAPQITRNLTDRRRYDCGDWARMGSDVLVEGELRDRGTEVEVAFQVWDPTRCLRLAQRSFRVPVSRLPQAARHVADLIVGVLTGSRGSSETEVAFISTRNGPSEVFVMDADGNRTRAATKSDARKSFPGWLPRAEAIVYTGFAAGGLPGLYLTSRGKMRPGPLLPKVLEGLPKYRGVVSPTGDAIAIVTSVGGASEIYLASLDGKRLRRLTDSAFIEVSPTWSPDGEQVAFVSDRSGSPQIYVVSRKGGTPRRITYQGGYNTSPAWSPDGRWIAYETRVEGQIDIWLVDPTGEVYVPIVAHRRDDESPTWSPDGRRIAFSSNRRGHFDIYQIDITGENLSRLTSGAGENTQPSWGPFPELE